MTSCVSVNNNSQNVISGMPETADSILYRFRWNMTKRSSTPIWSISRQRRCFLPTQLLMMGRWRDPDANCDSDDPDRDGLFNGNAAGNTLEKPFCKGFWSWSNDSVAIWWYNRLKKPGIDLNSFENAWITRLVRDYDAIGRDVWALDLTTDFGITSVVALRDREGDAERILIGLGCHLDPHIAVQRALAEMNQMLGIADADLDGPSDGLDDRETLEWLKTATVVNQPYLLRIQRLHDVGSMGCPITTVEICFVIFSIVAPVSKHKVWRCW